MRLKIFRAPMLLALFVFSLVLPAWGHGIDLFARAEGGQLIGGMTFADGTPASNCPIRAYSPDGTLLGETQTDGGGSFTLVLSVGVAHRLVGEPGHGHRAKYTVPESEILTALSTVTGALGPDMESSANTLSAHGMDSSLLEAAVARQIGPLRDQLHEHDKRMRLRDILGGIGYVFGLAGLYVLLNQRRAPVKPSVGD